jgi:hypothetical protein
MKANEWWQRIRAVERSAREGDPAPLHALCDELESMTEPPPVPVLPVIEPEETDEPLTDGE